MFESFFNKSKMSKDSKAKLEEIDILFEDKKYNEVITKVLPLINDKDEDTSLKFKSRLALAYFRKGDYKGSLSLFEAIAFKKNDVSSWFNIITSAILSNEIEKGKYAFNFALKLQEKSGFSKQPSVPFIRYYYAYALNEVGLFNEALEQLNELKSIYMDLAISDDKSLHMQGIPSLSLTLDLTRKVFNGLTRNFSMSDWLKELKEQLDDSGKKIIENNYEKE